MTFKVSNKPNSLSLFLRGFIVFCLFMFFITKPFIKKALTCTKSSVELCEEKERSTEENKSDKESNLFETDMPSQLSLANFYPVSFEINQLFNPKFSQDFKPKICPPPPKFV